MDAGAGRRGRIAGVSGTSRTAAPRRYGPDVGEPPLLADPRRWGSVVGLAGGLLFVAAYSAPLGPVVSAGAELVAVVLALAALVALYVRPVGLGPLVPPRPLAVGVYVGCVVGEVALIAVGTRALEHAGRGELRPALIAGVVGLHFLPMGWAFSERLFGWLGAAVAVVGGAGLLAGLGGVDRAAEASAVLAGLVMLGLIARYGRGDFARGGTRSPG